MSKEDSGTALEPTDSQLLQVLWGLEREFVQAELARESLLPEVTERFPIATRAVLTVLATFFTFTANNYGGLNIVVAASITGLLVALAAPKQGAPVFAGAFAGMASSHNIPSLGWCAVMAVCVVLVFEAFTYFRFAEGFGGRLGTVGMLACSATVAIGLATGDMAHQDFFDAPNYSDVTWAFWIPAILATPIGAVATIYVRVNLKPVCNPVGGSAFVGLLGGTALIAIGHEWADNAAASLFAGSFVGMATNTRIPNYTAYILCGLIDACVQIGFSGLLNKGWGGKLGFTAFVTTFIYLTCIKWWWPSIEDPSGRLTRRLNAPTQALDDDAAESNEEPSGLGRATTPPNEADRMMLGEWRATVGQQVEALNLLTRTLSNNSTTGPEERTRLHTTAFGGESEVRLIDEASFDMKESTRATTMY